MIGTGTRTSEMTSKAPPILVIPPCFSRLRHDRDNKAAPAINSKRIMLCIKLMPDVSGKFQILRKMAEATARSKTDRVIGKRPRRAYEIKYPTYT
jgi:hypothetical protein